jgi:methylisocitrate lyase
MPDLGISNLDDVLTDVRRITDVCDTPLLVDVDTGFGARRSTSRARRKSLIKSGAAAMHIEDQVGAKRCGHRPARRSSRRTRWPTASRRPPTRRPIRLRRHGAHRRAGRRRARRGDRARVRCVEAGADMIFPKR